MKKQTYLWIGITILLILAISFPIKIPVESGANFMTNDTLLGIIIFHNPFILGIYILISIILIIKARKK